MNQFGDKTKKSASDRGGFFCFDKHFLFVSQGGGKKVHISSFFDFHCFSECVNSDREVAYSEVGLVNTGQ